MNFFYNIKHFLYIVGSQKKKQFFFLIILLVLQSVLEAFSIALFVPVINTLLTNNIDFISHASAFLNLEIISGKQNILLFFLFIIFIFFVFKNLTLYKINKLYLEFAFDIQANLKDYIFSNYLNENSNIKSSKLISNLSVNSTLLSHYFTVPLMIFFSELFILISILFYLFFFNTKSFLVLLFFIIFIGIIYFSIISKKLKKIGIEKENNENLQIKAITNTMGSIKISKIYNIQKKLFSDFSNFNKECSRSLSKLNLFSNIPRFILELIAFLGLSFVLVYLIFSGETNEFIVLTIGVFAVAAFKLIPSINRVMSAIQHINFSDSIFVSLLNNISEPINLISKKKLKKNKILIKKYIALTGINFSYPGSDQTIIKNLNFTLKKGINIGITGQSGVGKSTFLDLLVGFGDISMGQIFIDGIKANNSKDEWFHNFSYVAQENYMFDDTLLNNIILNDKNITKKKLAKIHFILKILQLENLTKSSDGLNMRIGERGANLSGGQKQRIAIARAIYLNRPFIIMDEPTNALDLRTEKIFFNNINKISNSTFVIVSHKTQTFQNCDIIYKFLDGGRLKIIKKNFKKKEIIKNN
jgi:ATP-binding cassette subfamily C protein